jgi:hypothetical protein
MPLSAVSAAHFVLKDSVPSWVSLLPSGFFDTFMRLFCPTKNSAAKAGVV